MWGVKFGYQRVLPHLLLGFGLYKIYLIGSLLSKIQI